MEDRREEDVFEVVADEEAVDAFAASAGTKSLASEDVFGFAPGVGVGEDGGDSGDGVDVGGFHEERGLRVRGQGEGAGADEVLEGGSEMVGLGEVGPTSMKVLLERVGGGSWGVRGNADVMGKKRW